MDISRIKLAEAKSKVKLFALDYDGTVSDGNEYSLPQVMELAEKILAKGIPIAIITARAANALKNLAPVFMEYFRKNEISVPFFIAGGNGTMLHEIRNGHLMEIYNHGLSQSQILRVVEVSQSVYKKLKIKRDDLSPKGLETFQKFLKEDWKEYIHQEVVDICRSSNGEFFTEEAKVTFVFPKDKALHMPLLAEIKKELGEEYQVSAGDDTYLHITRKLEEDSKKSAIKEILKILSLQETEVVAFGDMPHGNDAGLLSFPYSFTNAEEYTKVGSKSDLPPYILSKEGLAPVARVHKAIKYLI